MDGFVCPSDDRRRAGSVGAGRRCAVAGPSSIGSTANHGGWLHRSAASWPRATGNKDDDRFCLLRNGPGPPLSRTTGYCVMLEGKGGRPRNSTRSEWPTAQCRLRDTENVLLATDGSDGQVHAGHMSDRGVAERQKEPTMQLNKTNPSTSATPGSPLRSRPSWAASPSGPTGPMTSPPKTPAATSCSSCSRFALGKNLSWPDRLAVRPRCSTVSARSDRPSCGIITGENDLAHIGVSVSGSGGLHHDDD